MVNWVEVELKIDGTLEENEKILLNNGFVLFYKRHNITNYYLPPDVDIKDKELKSKCVRIRKTIRLDKTGIDKDGISLMNPKGETGDKENIKKEKELLKTGHKLILTDNKLDWVFMHKNFEKNKVAFQLQEIAGIGLIVAYDNKNYYGKPHNEQKQLLINDIEKYGLKIKSKKQVDRFCQINDENRILLPFKEIVKLLNKETKLNK